MPDHSVQYGEFSLPGPRALYVLNPGFLYIGIKDNIELYQTKDKYVRPEYLNICVEIFNRPGVAGAVL